MKRILALSILSDKTTVRDIRGGTECPLFFSAYKHRKNFVKVSFFKLDSNLSFERKKTYKSLTVFAPHNYC